MSASELQSEIDAGVNFWGCEEAGVLIGVMGIQRVRDVHLIRHAYVRRDHQSKGIGGAVLKFLLDQEPGRILVGTWAAAEWAIRFYQRHGFRLLSPEEKSKLLRTYWNISERQEETSVVLELMARAPAVAFDGQQDAR
jgi:GNAT superfamily N-acetyltransferase